MTNNLKRYFKEFFNTDCGFAIIVIAAFGAIFASLSVIIALFVWWGVLGIIGMGLIALIYGAHKKTIEKLNGR